MNGLRRVVRLAGIAVVATAILGELRRPPGQRAWNGRIWGLVPYDLRPPTRERLRRAFWSPGVPRLLVAQPFGFGWTLNVGRLARLAGVA